MNQFGRFWCAVLEDIKKSKMLDPRLSCDVTSYHRLNFFLNYYCYFFFKQLGIEKFNLLLDFRDLIVFLMQAWQEMWQSLTRKRLHLTIICIPTHALCSFSKTASTLQNLTIATWQYWVHKVFYTDVTLSVFADIFCLLLRFMLTQRTRNIWSALMCQKG